MSITAPEIRKAASADLPLMRDILDDAFYDDPVPEWLFGKQGVAGSMFSPILKAVYLPQDLCFIADGGEGAAAWLPPGVEAKPGPLLMARMMAMLLFTAKSGAFKRLDALSTAMAQAHPKKDHYYLFAIGVRTGFQGRGIGKALMRPVLEQADREGMPCYLESSKESNIPVYRAVGFEVSGEIRPTPDAPVLYPMWRDPR